MRKPSAASVARAARRAAALAALGQVMAEVGAYRLKAAWDSFGPALRRAIESDRDLADEALAARLKRAYAYSEWLWMAQRHRVSWALGTHEMQRYILPTDARYDAALVAELRRIYKVVA